MGNLSLNLLTFPLWWYTAGWALLWAYNRRQVAFGIHQTGITLFFHHLNEPLYGDYTREGKFLSFWLRLVLLIFKSISLIFRLLLLIILDAVFLISLPVILALIIYQIIPGKL